MTRYNHGRSNTYDLTQDREKYHPTSGLLREFRRSMAWGRIINIFLSRMKPISRPTLLRRFMHADFSPTSQVPPYLPYIANGNSSILLTITKSCASSHLLGFETRQNQGAMHGAGTLIQGAPQPAITFRPIRGFTNGQCRRRYSLGLPGRRGWIGGAALRVTSSAQPPARTHAAPTTYPLYAGVSADEDLLNAGVF